MKFFFAILFVGCFIAFALGAEFMLIQKTSDTECSNPPLNQCNACPYNNTMMYTECNGSLDDDDIYVYCRVYSDPSCSQYVKGHSLNPIPCDALPQCGLSFQSDRLSQITVTSTSNLTVVAEDRVVINFDDGKIVVSGNLAGVAFASETSTLGFELTFDDGTYLTTAGQVAYGATETVGDITFTAEQIDNLPVVPFDVELRWYSSLGLRSTASDSTAVNLFEDNVTVDSDTMGNLVLMQKGYHGSIEEIANMALQNLDTNEPILYFQTYVNGVQKSYEYVKCQWSGLFSGSTAYYYYGSEQSPIVRCSLYLAFSAIEADSSYDSFSSFWAADVQQNFLQRLAAFFR